jgi:hypothetical protein
MKWAAAFRTQFAVFRLDGLSPAFAGLITVRALTWGSRPRLYAYACFAGLNLATALQANERHSANWQLAIGNWQLAITSFVPQRRQRIHA